MGHRIASFTVILIIVTVVAFGPAWPGTPERARAQTGFVDLVITKSDSPDPVVSGAEVTYTIVVKNAGTAPAGSPGTPVKIADWFALGFTYTSSSIEAPGTCESAPALSLVCHVDTLDPGESITLTLRGYYSNLADDVMLNRALVDLPISDITELVEVSNNVAVQETTILAPPPVGGVSLDAAGDPSASNSLSGPTIALLLCLVAGVFAAAGLRYVKP